MKVEKQLKEKKLNPPYDCPYYFSNWDGEDSCKLNDGDYCSFDAYTGCPEYNSICGIKIEVEE